ncbi:MAG: ABC transporter ATP-binding protein [Nitrospina sp.]|jgi:oligopeptide/dipeptide ABC transporter ATP-binding protein|nr:ABC transporter ATP-binding protein [Nitrospina sp.]MBT3857674.1 ABC transporter ATP-binding protein [Nitrospina sp.]MBT4106022.1 ABC transporter ATP-binding protein [Nitrospina sp.]MBT4389323.1 ABC transporter ATP-binding protein [Nitrospina sp.]MBT4621658.1 ABC transporter ATP-binding protein [Nitrospina sp.]
MPSPELEIQNLSVAFSSPRGKLIAVNGISFQLNPGETLALVGESGCGKTVSALSILRLLPEPPAKILSGKILFDNQDLLSLNAKALQDLRGNSISMIFQDPMTSLNPVLTVGEQIAETLLRHTTMNRREALQKSADLLNRVELPSPEEKLKYYPHQLSGGMRQRVMIAMALACAPRVLIADEPTTALDVLIQAQILELLESLKKEMSILIITHDLGVVSETAQRVLVMYAGEIVESGPTKALLKDPFHPYTKGLIASIPKLGDKKKPGARLEEISGNVPGLDQRPSGCPFHPRCSWAMETCKTQNPQLRKVESQRQVSCHLEPGSL